MSREETMSKIPTFIMRLNTIHKECYLVCKRCYKCINFNKCLTCCFMGETIKNIIYIPNRETLCFW